MSGINEVKADVYGYAKDTSATPDGENELVREPKRPWWHSVKEPGSAFQIVIAAALAVGIGLAVSTTVENIPAAATAIVGIPGRLWLRALRAKLKAMTKGGAVLAKWTIGYYVVTTCIAILHSILMVALVWSRLMTVVGEDSLAVDDDDQKTISDRSAVKVHDVVVTTFDTLIPQNIVNAFATDSLLAVLTTACVVGYLIKGPNSSLMRAVTEIEAIIIVVITFLIKLAPIGVFFLILPNLFQLDIAEIGVNLGILIGGSLTGIFLHLFIIIPLIYIAVCRANPYKLWFKGSPAWITAWGSASSAATMPVTMKCVVAQGTPDVVAKFTVPLGCLINMDGTAIYFPVVVVFLAATQGITLNGAEYVIIFLLATLASIGASPIPSSSLVLTVMIAQSVNVPITGMYAVVVTIDWFIDRFRTAMNVSADLYAAAIITKLTGITDEDEIDPDLQRELEEMNKV
ncbi:unnamed protein product [Cyclocybe aegerita]|uniref:Amino acid transporter n=1 Tax=Cyclocybe aegerita TaxID=1973307 RepID=A0A8S0W5P2_CYCAE|nr:unnamed protein product [Cyclocybe aegerita]